MRTGEAAKILGVDRKTIRNWIDDYGLQKYFSLSALGEDGAIQRVLTESDLLVLNTIRAQKVAGVYDWAQIALYLETGEREREFPQNAISADPRTIPVDQAHQSARAMATVAERDAAVSRIRELLDENEELRAMIERLEREKDEMKEALLREITRVQEPLLREIAELQRQLGKLEGQLEMYRDTPHRSGKDN
jgi:DNA-binding transcriptional MerR regulator